MEKSLVIGLLSLTIVGCSRSTPNDAPANGNVTPTASASASVPAVVVRPPPKLPPFENVRAELKAKCAPRDAGRGARAATAVTRDAGAEAGAPRGCLDGVLATEVEKALTPLRASDVTRFDALTREEAMFVQWTDDACALAAVSSGVDAPSRSRMAPPTPDAEASCRAHALAERVYYARAVAADDATSIATRVDELGGPGREVLDVLSRFGGYVTLQGRAIKPSNLIDAGTSLPRPITEVEQIDLGTRSRAVLSGAHALAQSSCRWAALAEYAGGPFACEDALVRYYLASPAVKTGL